MKKALLYMSVAALAFAGCAKEIDTTNEEKVAGKDQVTIYATIGDETKTTVDGEGYYAWQEDETIAVVEDGATSGAQFSLTDAENGAFTGTKTAEKDLIFAVSPEGALKSVDATTALSYQLTLPTTYSDYVPGTTNAVMVGTPNGGTYKFQFNHVAPLMKFTYANVPIGTKKFVFGSTENTLTGDWSFTETSDVSLAVANASNKGSQVTLTLAEEVYAANQTLSFYVPVPVDTYEDFLIELQDKNGSTISGTSKSKGGLSIPLAAGDIFPCPTVNLAEASKGSNWTYTFTKAGDLTTNEQTLNGKSVSSSPAATGYESNRGAQWSGGADPTITIKNSDYVENVVLVLSTNANANQVKAKVKVGGVQLGEELTVSTTANQSYSFAVEGNHYRKGDISIIITNSNNSKSAYLKTVTINDKTPAGLSYDAPAEYNVLAGSTFTPPTLNNPNNLSPITYESSDTDVASVNEETGAITVKTKKGTTTITASFEGNTLFKAGSATYTITVADPYLELPDATTPAKANCADNSTVTFDVDSNLEWTASEGTDDNNIIKSVSQDGNTVTVTFNANTAKVDKSAVINITPVDDIYSALATTMTVTQRGDRIEDILTYSLIAPSSGSGYQTFSSKSYAGDGHSSAVYAGKICVQTGANSNIQFNSDNNAGIVTTTSGGAIQKVAIVWYSGDAGLTIDVYGKNTAYSYASDLYDENKGEKLGSLVKGTNDELTIDGYYEFIGLRPSSSGARYLSSVTTTWGPSKAANGLEWRKSGSKTTTDSATIITGDDTLPTAELYNPHELNVSYNSTVSTVATINSTGVITLVGSGSTVISATFEGDATYRPGTVSYTLTVADERTACVNPTFSPLAGEVEQNTKVTVSSMTTGCTIYYTTNGDTPEVGGETTSAGEAGAAAVQVTIDAAKTIKAIAVKDDYKTSEVATASYTVAGVSTPLSKPSSLAITTISEASFTATWTNDTNATGYSWMLSSSSTVPASTSDSSVKAYGNFSTSSPTGFGASLDNNIWTLFKTGLELSGKYYLYVKAVGSGSYADSDYSSFCVITLTFDLTINPGTGDSAWPTSNSTTLTNYTYTLNDVDYTFALKNVKCNSGYLMCTNPAVLGLPAIDNNKLVTVKATNSSQCSTSTKVGISSSSSSASYISGGAIQTWSTTSSSYTYTLSSTSSGTVYYMYITNKNAQVTKLELTYVPSN